VIRLDEKKIDELIESTKSKMCEQRFEKGFKQLSKLAETNPEALYPKWDQIAALMDHENQYTKYIGLHLIAELTKADKKNKFDKIFNKYFNILYGERLIVAMVVAGAAGKIARNKPKLEPRITAKLLQVDKSKAKHKDTIKIKVIESFMEYFSDAKDKKAILKFVRGYPKWQSPKARKLAKQFLEKQG
jgi:hypothetical protein